MESLDHNFQAHSADQSATTWQMRQDWSITARWARIMAIIFFVFAGFGLLGVLGLSTIYGEMASVGGRVNPLMEAILSKVGVFSFLFLAIIAVQIAINLFQLRFANRLKIALQTNDQVTLEGAWEQFSQFFKWSGIMLIVLIVVYLGIMLFIIATLGSMMGGGGGL
ncbi:MAG: hypothetical protein ABMA02_09745 [Saprospiraceae bacterium]